MALVGVGVPDSWVWLQSRSVYVYVLSDWSLRYDTIPTAGLDVDTYCITELFGGDGFGHTSDNVIS